MTVRERNIQLPLQEIEAFCRRNPIQKLSFFGSVLGDRFTEASDIDCLVELTEDSRVGLFKFMGMQCEFEDLLGRRVDLRTPEDLHERFRDEVLRGAELVYARGRRQWTDS